MKKLIVIQFLLMATTILILILGLIELNLEYDEKLYKFIEFIENNDFYPLVFSAYNSQLNQTQGDPNLTASGTKTSFQTLALSRDLISNYNQPDDNLFNYGDTVTVIFSKKMIVEDTMNKRYVKRGDIWTLNENEAKIFGLQNGILIKKKKFINFKREN